MALHKHIFERVVVAVTDLFDKLDSNVYFLLWQSLQSGWHEGIRHTSSLWKGNHNETKNSSGTHDNIWCQFAMPAWSSVCVLWKQLVLWVFCPTHRVRPGAPQSWGEWDSLHMHKSWAVHTCTHTLMECEHAQSSAVPGFFSYTYKCTHTEYVHTLWKSW